MTQTFRSIEAFERTIAVQQRFIAQAYKQKDFVTGDDGFIYYWPDTKNGAYSAWMLRTLADELDKQNEDWQRIIDEDPNISDAEQLSLGL